MNRAAHILAYVLAQHLRLLLAHSQLPQRRQARPLSSADPAVLNATRASLSATKPNSLPQWVQERPSKCAACWHPGQVNSFIRVAFLRVSALVHKRFFAVTANRVGGISPETHSVCLPVLGLIIWFLAGPKG